MSNLPSKRDFLASEIDPETGKPFAKAGVVGKFSNRANAHAEANRDKWTEPEKVVKGPRAPRPTVQSQSSPVPANEPEVNPKEVRAWARQNGYTVGDRGRIHGDVVTAYVKAQGLPTGEPARRPTPLLMPRRRPQESGFSVVGGTLIRQDRCGNGPHSVAQCNCPDGPRAYKWLEREVGGPLVLTLDTPTA